MNQFLLLILLSMVPLSMSICCGRRKRSINEDYENFHNLAAQADDLLCNSPDLKRLLSNHMSTDSGLSSSASAAASLSSLTSSLEALGERFVVLCTPPPLNSNSSQSGFASFAYSLPHEAEFCSMAKESHACHVFADPRHLGSF